MPGRPPSGVRSNRKVLVPGLDRRQKSALANYVSHLPGVRTAKGKEAQRKEHAILRHRFNRGTLRFGEELNDPRKREAKREARNNKLWKASGIQHLSYQQVGHRTKTCRQTGGPGSTGHGTPSHREMDIASSSAEIHLLTQENAMEKKLFTPSRVPARCSPVVALLRRHSEDSPFRRSPTHPSSPGTLLLQGAQERQEVESVWI